MPPEVEFSRRYDDDLNGILDYVLSLSHPAAARFASAHDTTIQQLIDFPFSGQVEEDDVRSIRITGTPYRIVYRFAGNRLSIVRLSDARRADDAGRGERL